MVDGTLVGRTVAPDFFEPFIPTTIPAVKIVANRIGYVVILMIGLATFNRVESRRGEYRCDYFHRRKFLDYFLPGLLSQSFFIGIRYEYRAKITVALVAELTSGIKWIDIDPKVIQ